MGTEDEPRTIRLGGGDLPPALYQRIRFGAEADFADIGVEGCHDCGVTPGRLHMSLCDMEVCQRCAGQLLSCECEYVSND